MVHKLKPGHVAESHEVDTSKEEDYASFPSPSLRRSCRNSKRILPQRLDYLTNQNRFIGSKDWKDVEEMTDLVERKKLFKAIGKEIKSLRGNKACKLNKVMYGTVIFKTSSQSMEF